MTRRLSILRTTHAGGMVHVPVVLHWMKGEPVEFVELDPDKAIRVAEELLHAVRMAKAVDR